MQEPKLATNLFFTSQGNVLPPTSSHPKTFIADIIIAPRLPFCPGQICLMNLPPFYKLERKFNDLPIQISWRLAPMLHDRALQNVGPRGVSPLFQSLNSWNDNVLGRWSWIFPLQNYLFFRQIWKTIGLFWFFFFRIFTAACRRRVADQKAEKPSTSIQYKASPLEKLL